MGDFKEFLHVSTIHGLRYIATTKNLGRLFWIFVVFTGKLSQLSYKLSYKLSLFTGLLGSFYLINQSFQSWAESPIRTTIKTRPITDLTFPKVTVCPPKNSFTDLNYDLIMTRNVALDNETKEELTEYAMEVIQDHIHDEVMANINRLVEENRYYNWYNGITWIELPYYLDDGTFKYNIYTWDTSGRVSTQFYGDTFDAENVEEKIGFRVDIFIPTLSRRNENTTLHFNVEKRSMTELKNGYERIFIEEEGYLDSGTTSSSKNFTPPNDRFLGMKRGVKLERQITTDDVGNAKMDLMPGFEFSWYYSASSWYQVPQLRSYSDITISNQFIRLQVIKKAL